MTRFQDKSFSVHAGTGQEYRDNHDRIFGQRTPDLSAEHVVTFVDGKATAKRVTPEGSVVRCYQCSTQQPERYCKHMVGDGWTCIDRIACRTRRLETADGCHHDPGANHDPVPRTAEAPSDAQRGRAFIGEPGERQAQPSRETGSVLNGDD